MNKNINFMTSKNLNELLEEHKKITHPYKSYEFDSTSYILLICDINKVLKENTNLKQALIDIREYCNYNNEELYTCESDYDYEEELELNYNLSSFREDILQIIDKVLGGSNEEI